ncbi:MAG: hypothetical protein ACI9XO_003867, partial [Paraglaciecola sp.]
PTTTIKTQSTNYQLFMRITNATNEKNIESLILVKIKILTSLIFVILLKKN